MSEPSPFAVTIWLDEDGKTLSFSPVASPLAKWTVRLPEGAKLVSFPDRGLLICDVSGSLAGLNTAMYFARKKAFGYDVIDGYDPDHWLERIES